MCVKVKNTSTKKHLPTLRNDLKVVRNFGEADQILVINFKFSWCATIVTYSQSSLLRLWRYRVIPSMILWSVDKTKFLQSIPAIRDRITEHRRLKRKWMGLSFAGISYRAFTVLHKPAIADTQTWSRGQASDRPVPLEVSVKHTLSWNVAFW